ncbi:MAG: hypothetical protein ACI4JB_03300 [Porcipelethomonas sp.]
MTEDILLVMAMITDTFLVSLSYAGEKIKIPVSSAIIISFISSFVLTMSLCLSGYLGTFFPEEYCRVSGAVILGIIGIVQFCQNGLKSILKKHSGNGSVSFSYFNIGFVISVYLDETKADTDCSKILSARESVALALALSVDSLCGGAAAGISGGSILRVGVMSFIFGLLSVAIGGKVGRQINNKKIDLSWLSGVILIFLAVIKLF